MAQKYLSAAFSDLITKAVQEEYDTEPTVSLKEKYLQCCEQAEIEGMVKERISAFVLNQLEDKLYNITVKTNPKIEKIDCIINRRWYYQVVSRAGYVNPGRQKHTIHEHTHDENVLTLDCANKDVIERLRLCRELCIVAEHRFRACDDIAPAFKKSDLKEFYKQWDKIMDIGFNSFDMKTKIPTNTELFLMVALITESSTNLAGKKFLETRLKKMEELGNFLTTKQVAKFRHGDKETKLAILQPHEREMAIFLDYLGVECKTCRSYKVRIHPTASHMSICLDCDEVAEIDTIGKCPSCFKPLFKEVLCKMIENKNRCVNENCNKIIDLPDKLVQYAAQGLDD